MSFNKHPVNKKRRLISTRFLTRSQSFSLALHVYLGSKTRRKMSPSLAGRNVGLWSGVYRSGIGYSNSQLWIIHLSDHPPLSLSVIKPSERIFVIHQLSIDRVFRFFTSLHYPPTFIWFRSWRIIESWFHLMRLPTDNEKRSITNTSSVYNNGR